MNSLLKIHISLLLIVVPIGEILDAQPLEISGIYPHLAVQNRSSECGIGAVAFWADRLWAVTYSPHKPFGSDDKLYEIDLHLNLKISPESVGGTPANRMIHMESEQLIIGPYFIDKFRNVRVISPDLMPGRLTANARHLFLPEEKIYFVTMEEGLYEADVNSLEVNTLYTDANLLPGGVSGELLPGYHGKGAYTAQNQLVYSNNGDYETMKRAKKEHLSSFCLP